jgi:hypothetical protein
VTSQFNTPTQSVPSRLPSQKIQLVMVVPGARHAFLNHLTCMTCQKTVEGIALSNG